MPVDARRAVANTPLVICEAASDRASDPPEAWLLAWADDAKSAKFPVTATVARVGVPVSELYFPVVATDASPLVTCEALIAMGVEAAAVNRPSEPTVNVATDEAEP